MQKPELLTQLTRILQKSKSYTNYIKKPRISRNAHLFEALHQIQTTCDNNSTSVEKTKKPVKSFTSFFKPFETVLVGWTRFELATPCTPYKCATGLRHHPNDLQITSLKSLQVTQLHKIEGCKSKRKQ